MQRWPLIMKTGVYMYAGIRMNRNVAMIAGFYEGKTITQNI